MFIKTKTKQAQLNPKLFCWFFKIFFVYCKSILDIFFKLRIKSLLYIIVWCLKIFVQGIAAPTVCHIDRYSTLSAYYFVI